MGLRTPGILANIGKQSYRRPSCRNRPPDSRSSTSGSMPHGRIDDPDRAARRERIDRPPAPVPSPSARPATASPQRAGNALADRRPGSRRSVRRAAFVLLLPAFLRSMSVSWPATVPIPEERHRLGGAPSSTCHCRSDVRAGSSAALGPGRACRRHCGPRFLFAEPCCAMRLAVRLIPASSACLMPLAFLQLAAFHVGPAMDPLPGGEVLEISNSTTARTGATIAVFDPDHPWP